MSKKINNIVIIAFIALIAVTAVAIYVIYEPAQPFGVGVKPGDFFIYKITGNMDLHEGGLSVPDYFAETNQIDYCKIEITNVNFPQVFYTETTQYLNGTSYNSSGMIDINNGVNTNERGFWGIYCTGLTEGSLSRPLSPQGAIIEEIQTRTYRDGERQTLFIRAGNLAYDLDDETMSTTSHEYTYIYVDQQIGILVELTDLSVYNKPPVTLRLTWELVDSNVLQIK